MATRIIALLTLLAIANAGMYLVPAGKYHSTSHYGVRRLYNGDVICPRWYRRGFTIECRGGLKAPVSFSVTGKWVHSSKQFPHYITGKWRHNGAYYRARFTRFRSPHWESIRCASARGGKSYQATFHFSCRARDLARYAKIVARRRLRKVLPRRRKPQSKPKRKPKRKHTPRRKRSAPKPKARGPKRVRHVGKRGCVVINAAIPQRFKLPPGWTRGRNYNGITYKRGDKYGGIFRRGTAPLTYDFWVPRHARYGVVVDMRTTHWTEHNDIWLKFGYGGFNLRRWAKVRRNQRGFLKVYHNKNGRALESFSVDFDPHSFSTASKLSPWRKYTITVAARSTQVTIYRILLFPCKGISCQAASPFWKRSLRSCGKY